MYRNKRWTTVSCVTHNIFKFSSVSKCCKLNYAEKKKQDEKNNHCRFSHFASFRHPQQFSWQLSCLLHCDLKIGRFMKTRESHSVQKIACFTFTAQSGCYEWQLQFCATFYNSSKGQKPQNKNYPTKQRFSFLLVLNNWQVESDIYVGNYMYGQHWVFIHSEYQQIPLYIEE